MRPKSNYCLSRTLPIFLLGLAGCDNKVEDHQSDTSKIKTEQNRVRSGSAKTESDKRIDGQDPGSLRPTKMDVADIDEISNRSDFIKDVLTQRSPEEALAFLLRNQGKLTNKDNVIQSAWISKLSNVERSALEQGAQFVVIGLEGSLILKALASKVSLTQDFSDLKRTAEKFTDTRTRLRFLLTFLGSAVQSEPARVLPGLNQLIDLNLQPDDAGWYNQLVADTVGNIPADRVEKTWEQLGAIGDQKTRRLVAQRLLINYYNSDVFAASKWLDSVPNSDDKHWAVRALVEKLNVSGDKESAAAWRESLPEKYQLFLD